MTIANYLQGLLIQESQRLKQVQIECLPHQWFEYERLPERLRNLLPGRDRFIAFEDCTHALFDKGIRLTGLQNRLLTGMKMAACQRIFGDELIFNISFLQTRGITEFNTICYVLFPRRGGKSTTQQVGIAAQVLTQPNGRYIALSLFARQGYDWLESAVMYASQLKDHERFGYTVVADNREKFEIIPTAIGTTNSISTFPGGSAGSYNNLRGIGKQVWFILSVFPCLTNVYFCSRDL